MKLFIISDIHGSAVQFEKAYEAFEKEKAQKIIICGDFLYHGPRNNIPQNYDPKTLVILLNKHKEKIVAVKGNCDSEVDQMILDFPIMAEYSHILLDSDFCPEIFVHHGHKFSQEELKFLPQKTIIVSGHTHIEEIKSENNFYFLNPGSITIPKGKNAETYATIETFSHKIIIHLKKLDTNEIIEFLEIKTENE